MADLELTAPLPSLALASDQGGLSLLLRWRGRPVHFSLYEVAPGTRLSSVALWRLVGPAVRDELLAQAIREELAPVPETRPVSLTVAVCTRARPELLRDCLRSLVALRDGDGARRFEILVVDNDPPDDGTRAIVAALPGVRYVCEPAPGLDFARNRALRESTTTFVAYLDDDVVADRDWLAGLEEALAENPDAGAVTGLVLPYELESKPQVVFERRGGFRRGFRKLRYQGDHQPDNPLYPVGAGIFGAGCNMVLRVEVVEALGGFDEALDTGPPLPGGGDLDIFHRVVRAGHPLVYEPRMLVFHRHRTQRKALRRQYWSWGEGLTAYATKTYRADPELRPRLRGLLGWWLRHEVRQVAKSLLRPGAGPPDYPLAELAGGLAGMGGSYARSCRRVEQIRRVTSSAA